MLYRIEIRERVIKKKFENNESNRKIAKDLIVSESYVGRVIKSYKLKGKIEVPIRFLLGRLERLLLLERRMLLRTINTDPLISPSLRFYLPFA